ncbi:MAG: ABC-2 family transporter protein [Deltaproteobacteria bacterium]|nr:ABC-2 family transporter protein [Deltaproteobacteria bacterium]
MVRRYFKLLLVQLRASLATSMHYRADFVIDGLISLWWMAWTLVPLVLVYRWRSQIAGWSFYQALVVMAWFTLLRGLLEGAINPALQAIVEHIRTGTLDFVLLKPADAQFLVSTAKFAPWKALDIVTALVILSVALVRLGHVPSPGQVAVAGVLLLASALVLYSIWILVVCAAFWVVRLDNLNYLFSSIFDAARWPITVFRGGWRILFTFIIPLGVMTTYPAMALLGTLDPWTALASVVGAVLLASVSRFTWLRAMGRYTSASS